LASARGEERRGLLDERRQPHLLDVHRHLCGLETREAEDLLDEREEMVAARADPLELERLLAGQRAEDPVGEQLGVADDPRERRAQLVRHRREEVGLRAVGILRVEVELRVVEGERRALREVLGDGDVRRVVSPVRRRCHQGRQRAEDVPARDERHGQRGPRSEGLERCPLIRGAAQEPYQDVRVVAHEHGPAVLEGARDRAVRHPELRRMRAEAGGERRVSGERVGGGNASNVAPLGLEVDEGRVAEHRERDAGESRDDLIGIQRAAQRGARAREVRGVLGAPVARRRCRRPGCCPVPWRGGRSDGLHHPPDFGELTALRLDRAGGDGGQDRPAIGADERERPALDPVALGHPSELRTDGAALVVGDEHREGPPREEQPGPAEDLGRGAVRFTHRPESIGDDHRHGDELPPGIGVGRALGARPRAEVCGSADLVMQRTLPPWLGVAWLAGRHHHVEGDLPPSTAGRGPTRAIT
jgi:hypothetical protein